MGCSSVVHLAEGGGRVQDHLEAEHLLERVLDASESAGVRHLVLLLSSAMVYGAHANNPVPINESEPLRSDDKLAFVTAKRRMEGLADTWGASGRVVTVLRPTTALAEWGTSWVGRSLRAATLLRPDQVDPPVQFLHFDDLASAVTLARSGSKLPGRYNVAPDGWIGSEDFGQLIGSMSMRAPKKVSDLVLRAARSTGIRPTPEGIEPYVQFPWVVANDRLRAAGWKPEYTNAEAFVLGTAPPLWSVPPKHRQEVALAAAAVVTVGAIGGAVALGRKLLR